MMRSLPNRSTAPRAAVPRLGPHRSMMRQPCCRTGLLWGAPPAARSESFTTAALRSHGGALTSGSSRSPCRGSFDLAMAARLCVHALTDQKAFAPQDLAALLITFDLMSHSAGRLLFSSGGQLSAVTQGLDVARGICHRSRSRRVASDRLDTTARVKLDRYRHRDGRVDRLAPASTCTG